MVRSFRCAVRTTRISGDDTVSKNVVRRGDQCAELKRYRRLRQIAARRRIAQTLLALTGSVNLPVAVWCSAKGGAPSTYLLASSEDTFTYPHPSRDCSARFRLSPRTSAIASTTTAISTKARKMMRTTIYSCSSSIGASANNPQMQPSNSR